MKLESKIGKVQEKDEKIYLFLTDFDNFKSLIPADKVTDWQSDKDSCRFKIDPVGETGFKIIGKEEYKMIKLTSLDQTQYSFNFWVQLKMINDLETAIKLTMDVNLNPMMQMMAKKPIKQFLDTLVDQLCKIKY